MPLQPVLMTCQDFHVDQRGEDDGAALDFGRVVDLPYRLVGLVHAVDKGQAHVARLELELRQDGVTKGFGGDAGAVGDEKDGALGHGGRF
jgi:hypothetical protein